MLYIILAIYFFFEAVCQFFDLKLFQNARVEALEGEKRKKFRRMESIGTVLAALYVLAIYYMEDVAAREISLWVFIPVLVLIVEVIVYVEFVYYKKFQS